VFSWRRRSDPAHGITITILSAMERDLGCKRLWPREVLVHVNIFGLSLERRVEIANETWLL